MAFPQDDVDRDMLKSIVTEGERYILAGNGLDSMDTCSNPYPDYQGEDHRKSIAKMIEAGEVKSTRRFTRNEGGPYLCDTFIVKKDSRGVSLNFESEEDFFKWCSETAYSFDHNACQDVKDVKLWVEGSPGALICHHREGSFDLSPETVSLCLHVANVISVSCFLFCLRIGTFEDGNGSVINKSRLIDHLSRLSDKWTWCGENCMDAFHKWIDYVVDEVVSSEKEDALKLLYQWTVSPLECVLGSVKREIVGAPRHDYAEVERVGKWGDEVCVFLEELRNLFRISDVVQFLYSEMYRHHDLTADLHLILGNDKRAMELLETLRDMLEDVKANNLEVTELGPGKIEYLGIGLDAVVRNIGFQILELEDDEDGGETLRSIVSVRPPSDIKVESDHDEGGDEILGSGMRIHVTDIQVSRLPESRRLQIEEELHRGSDDVETHKQDYIKFPHDRQLEAIIYMIENNRYSEAREVFKQIDLKRQTYRAEMRTFLEFLNRPEIRLHLHRGISPNFT